MLKLKVYGKAQIIQQMVDSSTTLKKLKEDILAVCTAKYRTLIFSFSVLYSPTRESPPPAPKGVFERMYKLHR
jgi:D-arabinose 5-phosphate isomerase GutQ